MKKRTLAGRILRSVGLGILQGTPIVSAIVSDVREHKLARMPEEQAKEELKADMPFVRNASTVATVLGLVLGLVQGYVDCEALTELLRLVGVLKG